MSDSVPEIYERLEQTIDAILIDVGVQKAERGAVALLLDAAHRAAVRILTETLDLARFSGRRNAVVSDAQLAVEHFMERSGGPVISLGLGKEHDRAAACRLRVNAEELPNLFADSEERRSSLVASPMNVLNEQEALTPLLVAPHWALKHPPSSVDATKGPRVNVFSLQDIFGQTGRPGYAKPSNQLAVASTRAKRSEMVNMGGAAEEEPARKIRRVLLEQSSKSLSSQVTIQQIRQQAREPPVPAATLGSGTDPGLHSAKSGPSLAQVFPNDSSSIDT